LEREFLPRESAYLASTDDVIARVLALRTGDPVDRLAQVRRILTGTAAPIDAPVVLAASSTERAPGLYELDELRSDRAIATLIDHRTQAVPPGSDDVVVITDAEPPSDFETSQRTGTVRPPETMTATQLERAQRARVLPQGVFPVMELSARIADAPADERAIVEAIKGTPTTRAPLGERTGPWRVVVQCPTPVGDPPTTHRVVFTGTGEPEPLEVLGTPADGWDAALEDAAVDDLAPPVPSRRSERRLKAVLIAELVFAAAVIGAAWASGALSLAIRETPGWLGFAVTLAVAALAIGSIALLGRSDAEGNANDTFVVRRHYASRVELLATSTLVSAGMFALALASGVVPPILDAEPPVPAPVITFAAGNRVVTATVQVDGRDIATDEVVAVEVRQYSAEEADGVLIGRVTATGDSAGRVRVSEAMALDRGARFMSVLVTVGDRPAATCTPAAPGGAGCSIVSVPPLGAGVVRFQPAESAEDLIAESETTPSPSLSPSVAPTATTSPSISPSPTST
jgi:hypothetical protein